MQRLLNENMDKIKALCMTHNVKNLFAFGSICTDKFKDYYLGLNLIADELKNKTFTITAKIVKNPSMLLKEIN